MKLLIISDTHGNNHSLINLLINKEKPKLCIHAGDFINLSNVNTHKYGTLDYKNKFNYWVNGNHDLLAMNIDKYKASPKMFLDDMFNEYKVFKIKNKKFILSHFFENDSRILEQINSMVKDPFPMNEQETRQQEIINKHKPDYVITGHTHVPNISKKNQFVLINPGSLTKPRNGINGSYIIGNYDNKKNDWKFEIKYIDVKDLE